MKEIKYPAETLYWIATDKSGNILHYGTTEPGQVTTTGLDVITSYITEEECVAVLKQDFKVTDKQLLVSPLDTKKKPPNIWQIKTKYKEKDIVSFKEEFYVCIKDHLS